MNVCVVCDVPAVEPVDVGEINLDINVPAGNYEEIRMVQFFELEAMREYVAQGALVTVVI